MRKMCRLLHLITMCLISLSACQYPSDSPSSTAKTIGAQIDDSLHIYGRVADGQSATIDSLFDLPWPNDANLQIHRFNLGEDQYYQEIENSIAQGVPIIANDLSKNLIIEYYESDILQPINNCFEIYPELDQVEAVLLNQLSRNDQILGYPYGVSLYGIYYNKSILREAGWTSEEIENLPLQTIQGNFTYEDLLQTAEDVIQLKLVDNGFAIWPNIQFSELLSLSYLAFAGKPYFDFESSNVDIDVPNQKKAIETIWHLKQNEITHKFWVRDGGYFWTNALLTYDAVATNQVLFLFGTSNQWPRYKKVRAKTGVPIEDSIGFIPYPVASGNNFKVYGQESAFYILLNPELHPSHFEQACRFLTMLNSPAYQLAIANQDRGLSSIPISENYRVNLTLQALFLEEYRSFLRQSSSLDSIYWSDHEQLNRNLTDFANQVLREELTLDEANDLLLLNLKKDVENIVIRERPK